MDLADNRVADHFDVVDSAELVDLSCHGQVDAGQLENEYERVDVGVEAENEGVNVGVD